MKLRYVVLLVLAIFAVATLTVSAETGKANSENAADHSGDVVDPNSQGNDDPGNPHDGSEEKPGEGNGDKNHDHTGAPGQDEE